MGDAPHPSADQARQTRRMLRVSVIVAILLVVSSGWILFYDGPPPDDVRMLPQWTQEEAGKPNPLVVFLADIDSTALAAYEKLSADAKNRNPGSEAELREYLSKNQVNCDAFDKLMQTDIRTWRWPDGEDMAQPGYALTSIGEIGAIAQMLRQKIHLLKTEGKIEEAVGLSLNLLRFGAAQQSAEGMLIHLLVGLTCQRVGEDALRDTLANSPVPPELLKKTLRQLEAIPSTSREGFQFACKADYLAFKNITEKMDHGNILKAFGTTPTTTMVRDQLSAFFFKRNRTLSQRVELEWPVVEALDRSWAEAYAATAATRNFSAKYDRNKRRPSIYLDSNFGGASLLALTFEGSGKLIGRAMAADALKRQVELMLALRLYELEKGRLPSKLEDLVPDYVTAIPEDVFTGMAMHWHAAHETLYSVGGDGIDDDGRIDARRPHNGADIGMHYWWSKSPVAAPGPTNP